MAHARFMFAEQGHTRARTCTRPCSRTPPTPPYTLTHKYVILIALPQQHRFLQRASLLRYTYIACLALLYQPQTVWLRVYVCIYISVLHLLCQILVLSLVDFNAA